MSNRKAGLKPVLETHDSDSDRESTLSATTDDFKVEGRAPAFSLALTELISKKQHVSATDGFSEFIQTEKSYLSKLKALESHFVKPVAFYMSSEKIVTSEELRYTFGNVSELITTSQRLLDGLKVIRKAGFKASRLYSLFESLRLDIRAVYIDYATHYDKAVLLVKHYLKYRPRFLEVVKLGEFCSDCVLESLQIEPVQRVMRYVLLLRAVQSSLPSLAEKAEMEKTVKIVDEIVNEIDAAARRYKAVYMVRLIQHSIFKNRLSLYNGSRCWLKFQVMYKMKSKNKKKGLFILFNDFIMYCSIHKEIGTSGHTTSFKHALPLASAEVDLVPDSSDTKNVFQVFVESRTKFMTIMATDRELRDQWVAEIQRCIDIENALHQTMKTTPLPKTALEEELRRVPEFVPTIPILPEECPWLL